MSLIDALGDRYFGLFWENGQQGIVPEQIIEYARNITKDYFQGRVGASGAFEEALCGISGRKGRMF